MSPAERLLKEVTFAYRVCDSYDDTGRVEYAHPETGVVMRLEFHTQFVRPETFQFGFRNIDPKFQYELSRHGKGANLTRNGENEWFDSFDLAVASLSGVSMGSAHTVPRLLMWREVGGWPVTELDQASQLADVFIAGRRCLRVQGKHPWEEVWLELVVDAEILLIRQVVETMMVEGISVREYTTYNPSVVV
jgi:hypothetical protein